MKDEYKNVQQKFDVCSFNNGYKYISVNSSQ